MRRFVSMPSPLKSAPLVLTVALLGGIAAVRAWPVDEPDSPEEETDDTPLLRHSSQSITADEIFSQLIERSRLRDESLRQYSGVRTYVARNRRGKIYAREAVQVDYRAPDTKTFQTISETGSRLVRNLVFKRLIESETATSKGQQHRDSSIKPWNYSFRLLGEQDVGPYHCFVVEAIPKRNDKYLFRGKVWIDTQDFGIVKIAGRPVGHLSFWIKRVNFVRQYQKVGEFWLPLEDQTVAHLRIFGERILTIDHCGYAINGRELEDTPADVLLNGCGRAGDGDSDPNPQKLPDLHPVGGSPGGY